jgi:hypothetical protein
MVITVGMGEKSLSISEISVGDFYFLFVLWMASQSALMKVLFVDASQ